jgi:uncharacterized protein YbjT (DUF2867 family)
VRVLVIGAQGFIGRHVVQALEDAGHNVARGVRHPTSESEVCTDFGRMRQPQQWVSALRGVDAVVNAAGIFRERSAAQFTDVHDAGPRALFAACESAGVRRVVQVSALGADADARSAFHLSKRSADSDLAARSLDWVIVYPSLVFGPGGQSARQFAALASMPVVPLPGDGLQRVQPVHVHDLAAAIVSLTEGAASRSRIEAVGPRAVTVREWLDVLRAQMGLERAGFLQVPLALVRALVGSEAVDMLQRGNTAPPAAFSRVLGRLPRPVEAFVQGAEAELLRLTSLHAWLLPLLRWVLALTWVVSGVVSLGLHPVSSSLEMLARAGLTGALAYAALFGGALADVALGIATLLLKRGRRWMWRAQLALIAVYTAIITVALPELWLHPFGPVLKNLPMMAVIVLLHELEPGGRWNT